MNKQSLSRPKILVLAALLIAAGVAAYYGLARAGLAIPCLFYTLTGLLCPGCGNTRAALALLRLDFSAAFQFNPLFLVEFFYLAWILFHCGRAFLKGKPFSYKPPLPLLDMAILVAILAWWILRNCT